MRRVDDDYTEGIFDNEERYSRRKDRRVPRGRLRKRDLLAAEDTAGLPEERRFGDPELQRLFEMRKIDELLGEVKGGKEATVYLVTGAEGLMAAKVYADLRVRSFRNDGVYRQGRWIGDVRIEKAIEQRSSRGLEAQQDLWVLHEYQQLWQLFDAGLPVPKPMVGPARTDLGDAGRVVLMSYVGDRDVAAPRISDLRLQREEAEDAFEQSVEFARRLYALGKVHGDLSTYNLLCWHGEVVAIDFPQMVDVNDNPSADALLARDIVNLCRSFRRQGVRADPAVVETRVRGGG